MRHTAPLATSRWIGAAALALSLGCTGLEGETGTSTARQAGTGVVLPPAASSSSGPGTSNGGDTPAAPATTGTPSGYPPGTGTPDGGVDPGDGCTLTQGYWKNHSSKWPVTSLMLGTTSYTRAQLLAILHTETAGNGLVSMSHQLIAAKLNLAAGASSAGISDSISRADALIGGLVIPPHGAGFLATALTSPVNDALASFNQGNVGPGHCDDGPKPSPGTGYPPGDPVTPPPPTGTGYPPPQTTTPPPIVE